MARVLLPHLPKDMAAALALFAGGHGPIDATASVERRGSPELPLLLAVGAFLLCSVAVIRRAAQSADR